MIRIDIKSFTYPGRQAPSLQGISLEIRPAERLLITGPTGCGKSTLLKCINGIIPHTSEGVLIGDIIVNGRNTKETSLAEMARIVGMVQQNPDDQIFSPSVEDEVAFGPENLCLPAEEIDRRIHRALERVGMAGYRIHRVNALSGGQKQRVVIAAMLAMEPQVLLLDEPASQLDPKGARDILSVIADINQKSGCTIVLVEHRIHEVAHLVDRFIIMDKGRVILDADKKQVLKEHLHTFHRLGLRLPETVELFHRLKMDAQPQTPEDALVFLKKVMGAGNKALPEDTYTKVTKGRTAEVSPSPVVQAENLCFGYERDRWILKDVNFHVEQGEVVALIGNNGSGKSTLLLHMCGLLEPGRGHIRVCGRKTGDTRPETLVGEVAVVFQDPGLMLCCDTVGQEIAFGPGNLGVGDIEVKQRVDEALQVMTLESVVSRSPQSLSGGQRVRAAVASVISMNPKLLLLDEPTSGQDKRNINSLMHYLKQRAENGLTSVFVTHDMETALKYADRVVVMDKGRILANGDPARVLGDVDILEGTSLVPPQVLTLSAGLGLPLSFSVKELAEYLKPVLENV